MSQYDPSQWAMVTMDMAVPLPSRDLNVTAKTRPGSKGANSDRRTDRRWFFVPAVRYKAWMLRVLFLIAFAATFFPWFAPPYAEETHTLALVVGVGASAQVAPPPNACPHARA